MKRRLLCLPMLLWAAGCQTSPFVGTWTPTEDAASNRMVLRLEQNGTVFGSETPTGGRSNDFSGAWSVTDKDHANVTIVNPAPALTWQAVLHDGDQMSLATGPRVLNLRRLP